MTPGLRPSVTALAACALAALFALGTLATVGAAQTEARLLFDPTASDAPSDPWRLLELPRRSVTEYEIGVVEGRTALLARADDSAGGLFRRTELDVADWPRLEWSWRVESAFAGPVTRRDHDDYPVRLFVVFADDDWRGAARLRLRDLSRLRTLCYVWAPEGVADGLVYDSPYRDNVRMIAVRSGDASAGAWVTERRDLRDDFTRAFGDRPERVVGLGLMTDTDDLEITAGAAYGAIRVGAAEPSGGR